VPPFDAVVLRLGGLYGPDRDPARSLSGRTGVAGPDAPVNLVHRDDVIGVVQAILAQDVRNGVFNVVADAHPTKRAYYTARAEALGLPPPQLAESPVPWKKVSSRKVQDVLGYTFRHRPEV
jgi:nucleoside-diphosphate-sugar epimerase